MIVKSTVPTNWVLLKAKTQSEQVDCTHCLINLKDLKEWAMFTDMTQTLLDSFRTVIFVCLRTDCVTMLNLCDYEEELEAPFDFEGKYWMYIKEPPKDIEDYFCCTKEELLESHIHVYSGGVFNFIQRIATGRDMSEEFWSEELNINEL